jgi:hypothetical protein
LALIAVLAVAVHGYHLGVDDAAIYVPAIKRVADPALYPFGSEFFLSHARLSWFSNLVGGSARLSGVPIDMTIFLWHGIGIYLLLLAAWRLSGACFENQYARWSGVGLLAALLSVPVAGTALVIMDPYVTARTLSTPFTLFAIAEFVSGKTRRALLWLLAAGLIHPQMAFFAATLVGMLALERRRGKAAAVGMAAFAGLPFVFSFDPATGAAREALLSRTYFFVSNWEWYEWAGVVAPLALLWWLARVRPRGTTPAFRALACTLVPFGLLFTAMGIVLATSARLENYARLQPMRSFHLVYVVFFLLLGGLAGERLLRRKPVRWIILFAPLAASMWLLAWSTFPASPHVEWPGLVTSNPWVEAFRWIRGNTPKDAVFAMDPGYLLLPGEDTHGFRAVAERSALADRVKDSGAVSLFPQLAGEWKAEVDAQTGWDQFKLADFERLAALYPVTWILTRRPAPAGLDCPYVNRELAVCRIRATLRPGLPALAPVPGQVQAVAAVGGVKRDAVDVLAIVHREEHGAVKPAVFGHHIGLQAPGVAPDHGAGKDLGARALAAEGDDDPAAAINIDGGILDAARAVAIDADFAHAAAAEVEGIVPDEALVAATGFIAPHVAAATGFLAPHVGGAGLPVQAEVIAAEAAR